MVIHCLNNAPPEDRERLEAILGEHTRDNAKIKEAIGLLKKNGSIDYAKEFARKMVEGSWDEVDKALPDCEAKKSLKAFADYLVERDY